MDFVDYKNWYVETQLDNDQYYDMMGSIFAREFSAQLDVMLMAKYLVYLDTPPDLDTKGEQDALVATNEMRALMKRLRDGQPKETI